MPIRFKVRRMFAQNMRRFLRSRRGNIAALTALLIIPLAALMGMATEGGSWFLIQRAAQNAADSAAIAAATNGGNGGTDFVTEAKMVTSKYGFSDGGDTTITVPNPVTTYSSVSSCASSPCYRVTVSHNVPLHLLQVVGYSGNATVNGGAAQSVTATALATTKVINAPFCLTAIGGAIDPSGSPKANLDCNIQATGGTSCNPTHKLTSGYSDSLPNQSNTCGAHQRQVDKVSTPYDGLKNYIPSHSCSSGNSWVPTKKKDPALRSDNRWTTNSLPTGPICGDYQLQNDITISGGGVLVIANGSLDLNGHTLTGDGLTIILTGTSAAGHAQVIEGSGILDISSPQSGTWSGMAIYQENDTAIPMQPLKYSGNTPVMKISGIVYWPRTNFEVDGAVPDGDSYIKQSSDGYSCLTLVVNSMVIKGTGNLFYENPQSECARQGVTSPTNAAYVIGQLVY
ncbi:MAG: hypothetical protein J0I19_04795 [Alphaproteobacteria bacterium]|nr:hypothetical protein [Alphaproteobacteria bacterium]